MMIAMECIEFFIMATNCLGIIWLHDSCIKCLRLRISEREWNPTPYSTNYSNWSGVKQEKNLDFDIAPLID